MKVRNSNTGLKLIAGSVLSAAIILFSLTAHAAPPLSGAIFTTTQDGSVVNGNTIYVSKDEVYLDGGPGINAPQQAAGLPDGNYYFQVTDPSGKKLLSTDDVECRAFEVENGIIVGVIPGPGDCEHSTGDDVDHNAKTVQLIPYDDTPNNGGVYKVWVTPIANYVTNCGNGCFHGFIPAASKTDNFKVGDKEPTFCIHVKKEIIVKKGKGTEQVELGNWPIFITDYLGVENEHFTDGDGLLEVCGLDAGSYTVKEALEDMNNNLYMVVQTFLNAQEISPPTDTVTLSWTRGKPDHYVLYVNERCENNDCGGDKK